MLVVCQQRNLNIKEILLYSLGPTPSALAYKDGTLAKTDDALMHHIEAKCTSPLVNEVVLYDKVLVDGMVLIHKLVNHFPQTMGGSADLS